MIQGAAVGATAVLYDGAPDWPAPDRLWQLVEQLGVTVLGISPTLVRGLMRHGQEPIRGHDLSGLRAIGRAAMEPDAWWWCLREVGADGRRSSTTPGARRSGAHRSGTTVEPMRPCAFAGPVPGMAADVVDESGSAVRGGVGEARCASRGWG